MAAGDMFEFRAYNDDAVISAASVFLYEINGLNPSGTGYYLLLTNAAGTSVFQSLAVPAGAEFSWCPLSPWKLGGVGLRYIVSSTPDSVTPAAQNFWVWARGRET